MEFRVIFIIGFPIVERSDRNIIFLSVMSWETYTLDQRSNYPID